MIGMSQNSLMPSVQSLTSNLNKMYQTNAPKVYDWHIEADNRLIRDIKAKIGEKKGDLGEELDQNKQQLNVKCMELERLKDLDGVRFIKEWQAQREQILNNVNIKSEHNLTNLLKNIQEHRDQQQQTKLSIQSDYWRQTKIKMLGVIAVPTFATYLPTLLRALETSGESQQTDIGVEYNILKETLREELIYMPLEKLLLKKTLEEKINSLKGERDRTLQEIPNPSDELANQILLKKTLEEKRKLDVSTYIGVLEPYLDTDKSKQMLEYIQMLKAKEILSSAKNYAKNEQDNIKLAAEAFGKHMSNNKFPYDGFSYMNAGSRICWKKDGTQNGNVSSINDYTILATNNSKDIIQTVPKLFFDSEPSDGSNQIPNIKWGKIVPRRRPLPSDFIENTIDYIGKHLFKNYAAFENDDDFRIKMTTFINRLMGEVGVTGSSGAWKLTLDVISDDEIAEQLHIERDNKETCTLLKIFGGDNRYITTKYLGRKYKAPNQWHNDLETLEPKALEGEGIIPSIFSNWAQKKDDTVKKPIKNIFFSGLNSKAMPLAGAFGSNKHFDWIMKMLKKINTDFINPPAKDPTVLKIFNKHQEYEQNVKEDPSSENVALEKKYYNIYSEWRTRDLMYKKLHQDKNYIIDLKADEKVHISAEPPDKFPENISKVAEIVEKTDYRWKQWEQSALKETVKPNKKRIYRELFEKCVELASYEMSNPMDTIFEALTTPDLKYLDLNGITHIAFVLPNILEKKTEQSENVKVLVRDGLNSKERMMADSLGLGYQTDRQKIDSMSTMNDNMRLQMLSQTLGSKHFDPLEINTPITVPKSSLRDMDITIKFSVGIEWVWSLLPIQVQEWLVTTLWDKFTKAGQFIRVNAKSLAVVFISLVGLIYKFSGGPFITDFMEPIADNIGLSAVNGFKEAFASFKDKALKEAENVGDKATAVGQGVIENIKNASNMKLALGGLSVLAGGYAFYHMKDLIKKWFFEKYWIQMGSDMGAIGHFYKERSLFVKEYINKPFEEIRNMYNSDEKIDHMECIRIMDSCLINNVGQATMKHSLLDLYKIRLRMEQESVSARPDVLSNLNFLFLGNPGTGKTTTAENYFAKMLFATKLRKHTHVIPELNVKVPIVKDIEQYAVTARKGMDNMISSAASLMGAKTMNALVMTSLFNGAKIWYRGNKIKSGSHKDPYAVVGKAQEAWKKYEQKIIGLYLKDQPEEINFWSTSAVEMLMKDNPAAALNKKAEEMVNNEGGVIFIDEAYSLRPRTDNKGRQLYNLILLLSERHRNILSIILAGYKKEIEQNLISFNPGLARRFPKQVIFEDLSNADIRELLEMKLRKSRDINKNIKVSGWFMKENTKEIMIQRLIQKRSFPNFGNFATVMFMYNRAVSSAAKRLNLEWPSGPPGPVYDVPGLPVLTTSNSAAATSTVVVTATANLFEPSEARKKKNKRKKMQVELKDEPLPYEEIEVVDILGEKPSKNKSLQLLLAEEIGMYDSRTDTFGGFKINENGMPKFSSDADAKMPKFVGMHSIKKTLKELVDSSEYNWQQEKGGFPFVPIMLNKLFIGKPGTGKTEVALLWANIIHELRLLSDSSLVSKTASDFVGNVVGASQTKTNAILKASIGKVLFIDEAYVLAESQFGLEVLNTIVEQVQAKPGADISVIMAGYPKEMKAMCRNVNPGLGRRFDSQHPVLFEDYSDDQLSKIMVHMAKKRNITLLTSARDYAITEISKQRPSKDFGNAGTINLFLDKAIKAAMSRCLKNQGRWRKSPVNQIIDGIYGAKKYFGHQDIKKLRQALKYRHKYLKNIEEWQVKELEFIKGGYRGKFMEIVQNYINALKKVQRDNQFKIDETISKDERIQKLQTKKKEHENILRGQKDIQNRRKPQKIAARRKLKNKYKIMAQSGIFKKNKTTIPGLMQTIKTTIGEFEAWKEGWSLSSTPPTELNSGYNYIIDQYNSICHLFEENRIVILNGQNEIVEKKSVSTKEGIYAAIPQLKGLVGKLEVIKGIYDTISQQTTEVSDDQITKEIEQENILENSVVQGQIDEKDKEISKLLSSTDIQTFQEILQRVEKDKEELQKLQASIHSDINFNGTDLQYTNTKEKHWPELKKRIEAFNAHRHSSKKPEYKEMVHDDNFEQKKQLFLNWKPSKLVLTPFDFGQTVTEDPIQRLQKRGSNAELVTYIKALTDEYKACQQIWPLDQTKWPKAGNIIFHGNSGTGKTETANMLGEALKNAGILVSGETIVRSASDLEGTVVGEAQKLVEQAMEEAIGGILLIDEAYELGRSEYGRQAQTKLIAMLEEEKFNNGKVVVILCGYQDKMQKMMRRNQGMASRFTKEFVFKDVEPEKATKTITDTLRRDYFIEKGSDTNPTECLHSFMEFLRRSENFGNYRDCRNISNEIKSLVYSRLVSDNLEMFNRAAAEQKQRFDTEEKKSQKKAEYEKYKDFVPNDPIEPRPVMEPPETPRPPPRSPTSKHFTLQDVINVCNPRAKSRLKKPKRSASALEIKHYNEIMKCLEKITTENFKQTFQEIQGLRETLNMENNINKSVNNDISRRDRMKHWLSLQKEKQLKEEYDTEIRKKFGRAAPAPVPVAAASSPAPVPVTEGESKKAYDRGSRRKRMYTSSLKF